jgi:hypothetical protein
VEFNKKVQQAPPQNPSETACAGLGETYKRTALGEPALLDRAFEAGGVFGWRAPQLEQESAVQLLDQDAVVEVRL